LIVIGQFLTLTASSILLLLIVDHASGFSLVSLSASYSTRVSTPITSNNGLGLRGCDPLDATNASKHSIDQSEDKILQINQSKNASKHS